MELDADEAWARASDTHRLIPSRYPPHGIFEGISTLDELADIFDLESWTNDRLQAELGKLATIPRSQWLVGVPNASVVMAAFCHPHVNGGRFTSPSLGGWYAAFDLETAHRETIFRRTQELREVGAQDLTVQMRDYLADFDCALHDVRDATRYAPLYDPESYEASQLFGVRLRGAGSNGVWYSSVRNPGAECLVTFKPTLVLNARQGAHFEYVWRGSPEPSVRRLSDAT